MKKALIIGITGQDAYYLSKLLISKNYKVYGVIRGQNNPKLPLIEKELPEVELIEGDLLDETSLTRALSKAEPEEVYNLGAITFVKYSFDNPVLTGNVTGLGVVRLLELIRTINPKIKYFQPASAEMYGNAIETPQSETTLFNPQSPYAIAKVFAYQTTKFYREAFGIFACNGILFNHESPRRGLEFVTRKISNGVARIALGKQKVLILGNIEAKRDWGFAKDYVEAMFLMMQHPNPDDYVIATNEAHSVKEFLDLAFKFVGIKKWSKYVIANDPRYIRPLDVPCLIGNNVKARKKLGWTSKTTFKQLVEIIVKNDLEIEKDSVALSQECKNSSKLI